MRCIIKENETFVLTTPNVPVYAEGVSTYIAIIIKGTFKDDSFALMHYWDINETDDAASLVYNCNNSILSHFGYPSTRSKPVNVADVWVIGGEKKQRGLFGVSGTEKAVNMLKSQLAGALSNEFTIASGAKIHYHNFLTTNEQFVDVSIELNDDAPTIAKYNNASDTAPLICEAGIVQTLEASIERPAKRRKIGN